MLSHIKLHLARAPSFPEGSTRHGYEIVAPLNEDGHLDSEAWHYERTHCTVRRFWAGEADRVGLLIHRAGGTGGAHWVIDYDVNTADDDEEGYRLDVHTFTPGEYITIKDSTGPHTFRIASVTERKSKAAS